MLNLSSLKKGDYIRCIKEITRGDYADIGDVRQVIEPFRYADFIENWEHVIVEPDIRIPQTGVFYTNIYIDTRKTPPIIHYVRTDTRAEADNFLISFKRIARIRTEWTENQYDN